jgi:hypothetical protein
MWLLISCFRMLTHCLNLSKLPSLPCVRFWDLLKMSTPLAFFFFKDKLHHHLTTHLNLRLGMFSQDFYIMDIFTYTQAITTWREKKTHTNFHSWNLQRLWLSYELKKLAIICSIFFSIINNVDVIVVIYIYIYMIFGSW